MSSSLSVKRQRLTNTVIAFPIIYGSVAYWLGKKAVLDQATHRWTLFIKGPNDEDMSSFISKVAFSLHPSFPEPIREITKSPFEVTENGWGEFDVGIRIFWNDPEEEPIDLHHSLKLYHPEGSNTFNSKKPVVFAKYDEIVFSDPTPQFKRLLMLKTDCKHSINTPSDILPVFDDSVDLQKLTEIQAHIQREIELAKSRVLELDIEINQIQPSDVMNSFPNSHKNNIVKSEIQSNSSNMINNSNKTSISSKSNNGTKLYKKKNVDSLGSGGYAASKASKTSKKVTEKLKKNEIVLPKNVSNSVNNNVSVPAEIIIQ